MIVFFVILVAVLSALLIDYSKLSTLPKAGYSSFMESAEPLPRYTGMGLARMAPILGVLLAVEIELEQSLSLLVGVSLVKAPAFCGVSKYCD